MSSWSEGTDSGVKSKFPSKQTPPVCCWNTPTTSWLVQYGFLCSSCIFLTSLLHSQVTGDVQEHIPLKQKKTLNYQCYVLFCFVFNVMFWLTTNVGRILVLWQSPLSSSVACPFSSCLSYSCKLFCSYSVSASWIGCPLNRNLIYLIDKPYLS